MTTARLLIACPDARGVVAGVASHLADAHCNILEADQHTDPDEGSFFMRLEFSLGGRSRDDVLGDAWDQLADRFSMRWRFDDGTRAKRVAILSGKETHCLSDLLWRWSIDELRCEIPLVISNHESGRAITEAFGIPFHHLPVTPETKGAQEAQIASLLSDHDIDLVVLARYMQVLSPSVVEPYPSRIINIHHGFLPAFAGARPYDQAFRRGVKIVGATAHYVTDELDDGPIIAQQTTHISHRDTVADLVRKGRDLERVVLAEAVRLHLEDSVIVTGRRTVVFA